jgi:hypothetical protein
MNPFQRRIVFFFLLALLASVVASCGAIGDRLTANVDVTVVSDWNASSVVKPTCVIKQGAEVEIVDFPEKNRPSGGETMYMLSAVDGSCTGTVYNLIGFTPVAKK